MIMPHPSKKQRLNDMETDLAEASPAAELAVTAGDLSVDVLANILGYLDLKEIMQNIYFSNLLPTRKYSKGFMDCCMDFSDDCRNLYKYTPRNDYSLETNGTDTSLADRGWNEFDFNDPNGTGNESD